MLPKLWSFMKRATVGEKIHDVGRVDGDWGDSTHVDIRRGSDGSTFVTVAMASNFSVRVNDRKTIYAFLDDFAAERLATHLMTAVRKRKELEAVADDGL